MIRRSVLNLSDSPDSGTEPDGLGHGGLHNSELPFETASGPEMCSPLMILEDNLDHSFLPQALGLSPGKVEPVHNLSLVQSAVMVEATDLHKNSPAIQRSCHLRIRSYLSRNWILSF